MPSKRKSTDCPVFGDAPATYSKHKLAKHDHAADQSDSQTNKPSAKPLLVKPASRPNDQSDDEHHEPADQIDGGMMVESDVKPIKKSKLSTSLLVKPAVKAANPSDQQSIRESESDKPVTAKADKPAAVHSRRGSKKKLAVTETEDDQSIEHEEPAPANSTKRPVKKPIKPTKPVIKETNKQTVKKSKKRTHSSSESDDESDSEHSADDKPASKTIKRSKKQSKGDESEDDVEDKPLTKQPKKPSKSSNKDKPAKQSMKQPIGQSSSDEEAKSDEESESDEKKKQAKKPEKKPEKKAIKTPVTNTLSQPLKLAHPRTLPVKPSSQAINQPNKSSPSDVVALTAKLQADARLKLNSLSPESALYPSSSVQPATSGANDHADEKPIKQSNKTIAKKRSKKANRENSPPDSNADKKSTEPAKVSKKKADVVSGSNNDAESEFAHLDDADATFEVHVDNQQRNQPTYDGKDFKNTFSHVTALVISSTDQSSAQLVSKLEALGATVLEEINEEVTHVIVSPDQSYDKSLIDQSTAHLTEVERLNSCKANEHPDCLIVTADWIHETFAGKDVDGHDFVITRQEAEHMLNQSINQSVNHSPDDSDASAPAKKLNEESDLSEHSEVDESSIRSIKSVTDVKQASEAEAVEATTVADQSVNQPVEPAANSDDNSLEFPADEIEPAPEGWQKKKKQKKEAVAVSSVVSIADAPKTPSKLKPKPKGVNKKAETEAMSDNVKPVKAKPDKPTKSTKSKKVSFPDSPVTPTPHNSPAPEILEDFVLDGSQVQDIESFMAMPTSSLESIPQADMLKQKKKKARRIAVSSDSDSDFVSETRRDASSSSPSSSKKSNKPSGKQANKSSTPTAKRRRITKSKTLDFSSDEDDAVKTKTTKQPTKSSKQSRAENGLSSLSGIGLESEYVPPNSISISTNVNKADRERMVDIIDDMPGFKLVEPDEPCTHLIVDAVKPKRSLNVLRAIIRGSYILKSTWLLDCYDGDVPVKGSEAKYWVDDTLWPAARHRHDNSNIIDKPLFLDSVFIASRVSPAREELAELCRRVGMTVEDDYSSADMCLAPDNCTRHDLDHHARDVATKYRQPFVSPKFIIESITQWKALDIKPFIIKTPLTKKEEDAATLSPSY